MNALLWTGQNSVHIFGILFLLQTNTQTDGQLFYKEMAETCDLFLKCYAGLTEIGGNRHGGLVVKASAS